MFYSNVEMNEVLYAEADIQAAQYVIIQSFANVINAVNQNMYAEADNKASEGILAKVVNFFKNLGNKVIEFIKKLINVTLSLLLKPFGAKIAIGSGGKTTESSGGGGGGSSSGSSEETPKSKLAPKSGNMTEIANLLKKLSLYLQSESPSDVAYKSVVDRTNPFTINDKGTYMEITKDSSKGAIEAVLNTLKTLVGDIDSTISNFKIYNNKINKADDIINTNSSEKLLSNAIHGINSKPEQAAIKQMATEDSTGQSIIPKAHPSLSLTFNVIDSKKIEEFRKHAHALTSLINLIEDVLEFSDIITNSSEIIMKDTNPNYVQYCNSYGKRVGAHTISVKSDADKKGIEGENYNLFGVPSTVALVGSRFFFIRSLEQTQFESFLSKSVLDDMVNKCPVMKDYVGANYRNVLVSNKAYDFSTIDKTFKSVSISGGADLNKFITEANSGFTPLIKTSISRLTNTLAKFKELDKRLNTENTDGITDASKKASKQEAVETELAKKGNPAAALREFIGNSAKIIRNMSSVTSESCSAIREMYYELEAASNCVGVVIMANVIMYKRDYIHYACKAITEVLNDEKYRAKEFKKEADVTRVRGEVKKVLADLSKISKQYKF